MIIPHLHFGGRCKDALDFYKSTFSATVDLVEYDSEDSSNPKVFHAEMTICNQKIMLNDAPSDINFCDHSPIKLVVLLDSEKKLKKIYDQLIVDGRSLKPLHKTEYSSCVALLQDKFGITWSLLI